MIERDKEDDAAGEAAADTPDDRACGELGAGDGTGEGLRAGEGLTGGDGPGEGLIGGDGCGEEGRSDAKLESGEGDKGKPETTCDKEDEDSKSSAKKPGETEADADAEADDEPPRWQQFWLTITSGKP